jgi:hypothetical protein
MKTFGIKYPSFRTDFKNAHMTLVKSAPKKSFRQFFKKVLKIVFLVKTFLGAIFTHTQYRRRKEQPHHSLS